jgi:hypothetical protein
MEDQSYLILKSLLPEEWAVHEYRPDYGIDLVVEIFKFIDETREAADTLGELFFVQLKSVKQTKIQKLTVKARGNVEKADATYDDSDTKEIEVIPYVIDTDELLTVQTMGPTIAVVLCLVCLDTGRVFFICLNDLVEKVLLADDPKYTEKGTKTIYLPVKNEITKGGAPLHALRFMAKRPKFYAAFNRFNYQQNEIWYYLGFAKPGIITYRNEVEPEHELEAETRPMIRRFIAILKYLDIWFGNSAWDLVGHYYARLSKMEALLDDPTIETREIISEMLLLWAGLTALASTYEEICREWFLPTYLGDSLS